MDMSYLASSFYLLIGLACGLYLLFYLIFRRSIVSFSDPLNFGGLLIASYLAGALVLPSLRAINLSYIYVIVLAFLYVVAGAFFSRNRTSISAPRLGVRLRHQILFTLVLSGLLILNVVINQIFGVIPLLLGTQARVDSVPSPTLSLLAPDIGTIVLLVLLLSRTKVVRVLAAIGVGSSVVSTILGGSKSALFGVLLMILVADYVLSLRRTAARLPAEKLALTRERRILRRSGAVCAIGIAIMLPAYLVIIGASSGSGTGGLEALATRLFGGFDGLAIIAVKDVDITSVHGVNISGFYLYPILNKLSIAPEFRSAGVYLIYVLTGSYDLATSGLNPNSTYPIELLLSNGSVALSGLLIALTAAIMFRVRSALIRREHLRMFDLVLWALVVLGPFSILIDGAYFVIRSYELLGLYMAVNTLANALTWIGPGRKVYRLL